jgi:hypothetical protein
MNNLPSFEQLKADFKALSVQVESEFAGLSIEQLNYKTDATSWSILECLEHLNCYAAYYNTALAKGIEKEKGSKKPYTYKLTWFGKMSIDLISPSNTKKQKTIKRMNPMNSTLLEQTISDFLAYQEELLQLLDAASLINANKKRVPVEFFKLIRLNIFETLIFMAEHEKRHIQQAMRVKEALLVMKKDVVFK